MVLDWIISAGTIAAKCLGVALTFAVCIALYLVETQQISKSSK